MPVQFDVAIFAANEAERLKSCVMAIDQACCRYASRISVILNGTTDNSRSILESTHIHNAFLRVYSIKIADKSNAINNFIYNLRDREADAHFFIDGYVMIDRNALRLLVDALAANPHAHIASGFPLSGRSAKAIANEIRTDRRGVRGNLFAMRPAFADHIVAAQVRLPMSLYWGDGLLGSMAKHDLDPVINRPWDETRVIEAIDATYKFRPMSPFRWRDVQRQYRRVVRQVRGRIENAVINEIVYQRGYTALPMNINDATIEWLRRNRPPIPRSLAERAVIRQALKQIVTAPRPTPMHAELIFERHNCSDRPR